MMNKKGPLFWNRNSVRKCSTTEKLKLNSKINSRSMKAFIGNGFTCWHENGAGSVVNKGLMIVNGGRTTSEQYINLFDEEDNII